MSAAAAAGGSEGVLNYERPAKPAATTHPPNRGRGNTRLEVSEGDLASEQLPQAEGVAEHVRLDRVAGALGEHLRSHPAEVLHTHTNTHTHGHTRANYWHEHRVSARTKFHPGDAVARPDHHCSAHQALIPVMSQHTDSKSARRQLHVVVFSQGAN